jgi:hypothetical protein
MTQHFDEIILTGSYAEGFLGAALSEGLVLITEEESTSELIMRAKKSQYKRRALELYLLFEKVHLRNFHPDILFPSLHEEGRITTDARHSMQAIKFFRAFNKEPIKAMNRYREFLSDIYYLKPLLLEEILKVQEHEPWKNLRLKLKISQEEMLAALFDLTLGWYIPFREVEDKELMLSSFGSQTKASIVLDLVEIASQPKKERLYDLSFAPTYLLAHGNSLINVLDESASLGCPVAWGSNPRSKPRSVRDVETTVDKVQKVFHLVRCAFREENLVFPVVESFSDVDRLRRDTRLRDFQEALSYFITELGKGDIKTAAKIREDVCKANAALASIKQCRKIGEIVTFFSLPVVLVDELVTGGILGLIVALLGSATIAYSKFREQRQGWVLFGQTQ